MPDTVSIATRQTSAHRRLMTAGLEDDARISRLQLAVARMDLRRTGPPALLVGFSMPTPGIVREGADAYVPDDRSGRIRGDAAMRSALALPAAVDLIRADELVNGPGDLWVGNGNAGMNRGCPAWSGNVLHHCLQDRALITSGYLFDACVWYADGRAAIERVRFVEDPSGAWTARVEGEPPGGEVKLIVCGPRLVERGRALNPYANADSREARSYPDLRHLVLNAYVPVRGLGTRAPVRDGHGRPVRRDFGLDQLMRDDKRRRAAIEGDVVEQPMQVVDVDDVVYAVAADDLTAAFLDKSYEPCATLDELTHRRQKGERGLFFIDEPLGRCFIVYAPSPYPLHALAIRENGDSTIFHVAVGGSSNVGGATVADFASGLCSSGFRDALLLDNGGDVVMVSRRHGNQRDWPDPNGSCAIVPSSLRRTQWATLLLYRDPTADGIHVLSDHRGESGLYSVTFPALAT